MLKNIIGKLSQLERSNNKCYTSAFRYIYIYIYIDYMFIYSHVLNYTYINLILECVTVNKFTTCQIII